VDTEFHDEALVEYHSSALYSENVFGLGEEFVQSMERAIVEISSGPIRYKKAGKHLHDYRLNRFPYHLFHYRAPGSGLVTILAAAHSSRRPDYWKSRI